ncbi:glycoside hydrolase family 55 protein [Streptomyces sp. NBC_01498]|uniref:glycoside hydrolase family 55 protein n=1 Tax=Streptomyces sp. NBC_01498 TaxID=2975870 RepID=UPI002E7B046F|nr:glycoside hydrolase family 55 protein [Streptomyces sp. NBC_01498]WTL26144.1 glycoside hydrolase family 55 protein [Streptomyces sp. NBC_01498]
MVGNARLDRRNRQPDRQDQLDRQDQPDRQDRPNLGRRGLLAGAVAVAAGATATAFGTGAGIGPAAAATRTPGPYGSPAPPAPRTSSARTSPRLSPLWREFAASPLSHPQIPYVGRAGQRAGSDRLPRPRVVADVRAYGARNDGSADAAPAINRALADAGRRGGGTVLVPAGTYRVDDIIRISHSGVVLRGAGSGRTTLLATKNLTELIGPYGSRFGGDKSSWSWAGGLIWLAPEARLGSLIDSIRAKKWPVEGWTGNDRTEFEPLTAVAPARRGDRTVRVADASRIRRGEIVLFRVSDDADHTLLEHMSGGGPGTESYDWSDKSKLLSYVPYEWPVRVTSVRGRELTLERPLPVDLRPEWNTLITTLVTPLTGAGVEGLTLEAVETPQSPHLLDKGHNGVTFQCAYDCWADDVTVRNADNGFGLVAASACTLRRTRVEGRGSHHPYFCREASHDNLIEDFFIAARTVPAPAGTQLHGINVEGLSSYNVWSRGVMEMGTFDTHRGLPFANLRTEITLDNNGTHGGDASAGPLYGARFTHWNVTVLNERAGLVRIDGIAPYSATAGISEVREFGQIDVPDFQGELHARLESYGRPQDMRPSNLYEAQRALKLPGRRSGRG